MKHASSEQAFSYELIRLARRYRQGANEALAGFGLSDALSLPVVVLARMGDGVRQHHLADEMGIEGPSLVRLLDRLVEQGWIERREDKTDRRAKTLHLTDAGRLQAEKAEAALTLFRQLVLADAAPEDLEACLRVFSGIRARLHSAEESKSGRRP